MGNLNKESLHKNYKSQQEVDDQNLGMTVIFWIAAIIIASFFIISSIPWSTMDQFDILIGIVIVAFASAIIVGTVKGIRNNKHKDEALKRFNALSEFKATEYYLSKTSGSSIGFDNDRKKSASSTTIIDHTFTTTIKFCNVKLLLMGRQF